MTDRRRILVVDDEPAVVRALSRILGRKYEVVAANGGVEAMAILDADARFDLVLCDLMMPDADGIDVHGHVAQIAPQLLSRFLFMSGGVFAERARAFIAAQKVPILDKPFEMAEVQRIVDARIESGA